MLTVNRVNVRLSAPSRLWCTRGVSHTTEQARCVVVEFFVGEPGVPQSEGQTLGDPQADDTSSSKYNCNDGLDTLWTKEKKEPPQRPSAPCKRLRPLDHPPITTQDVPTPALTFCCSRSRDDELTHFERGTFSSKWGWGYPCVVPVHCAVLPGPWARRKRKRNLDTIMGQTPMVSLGQD